MSDTSLQCCALPPKRRAWMVDVLPFVTSLSVHASLVIVGLLTYQAVRVAARVPPPNQAVIPESVFFWDQPGSTTSPIGGGPSSFKLMPQGDTSDSPSGFSQSHPVSGMPQIGGRDGGSAAEPSMRGFDAGATIGPLGHSAGIDAGPENFGVHGGGAGLEGPVFIGGHGSRSIIFVCDGTGSMINKIAQLKIELSRTVQGLKPTQSFNIFFYQDEKVLKLSGSRMVAANSRNIREADAWLGDICTTGATDPVPALTAALAARPQLMYFLTDAADFPDVPAVQNVFRKLNADHKTKVNTILFVESRQEQEAIKESEPLMSGIARENGGTFKWVVLDDLR